MRNHRPVGLFLSCLILSVPLLTLQPACAESPSGYFFKVDSAEVENFRLEIFDRSSRERLYDSGIVPAESFHLDDASLPEKSSGSVWYFELRAWDETGELVSSHAGRLAGASQISAIDFEQIPGGTGLSSGIIALDGTVEVSGDLQVSGITRTAGLTDSVGSSFFGACASQSAIRTIDTDGTVQCESTGDGLGDHQADMNLQLRGFFLSGDGGNEGIFIDNEGDVAIGTSDTGLADLRVEGAGGSRLGFNTSSSLPNLSVTSFDSDPAVFSLISGSSSFQLRTTSNNRFHIFTTSPVVSVDSTGRVGIGVQDPDFLLHVNGTAGKPGGGSWSVASDARLKAIDGHFDRGLEALRALEPIRYHYRTDNALGLASDEAYVGFRAQDVRRSIPEAVSEGRDGFLYVDNDPILWTMLNAILELDARSQDCGRVEGQEE